MKAYAVHDNYEGYGAVVFAAYAATARRLGANELGIEWESVESCRRAPHFDQYAPGPVPTMVLIEHGWWSECVHCGRRVSNDMADELESDGLDPDDFVPRPAGKGGVFCSEGCECAHHMKQLHREEATDALREAFEAIFPGASVDHLHIADGLQLNGKCCVTFSFPGGAGATWFFGDDFCKVPQYAVAAYHRWRGLQAPAEEIAA